MSRFAQPPTRANDLKKTKKKVFKQSPCGRPPATPTGLTHDYDRNEEGLHNRLRANLRWSEVTTDTSGVTIRLRHYIVEVQYTANGTDWFDAKRHTISAKDDADPGTKAHLILKGLNSKLAYRYKVRAVGLDGCKSPFSTTHVMGTAAPDGPPAPFNVRILEKGKMHQAIRMVWDADEDASDSDLFPDKIHHFVCQLSKSQTFSTIYKTVRGVKHQHVVFHVEDEDLGDMFFARVRSVSPDKDKSSFIPAANSRPGNDDPGALALGVEAGDGVEPGTTRWFAKSVPVIHNGQWLRQNGDLYSTTEYADLFGAIGYLYGGSGANFAVPDVRKRSMKGVGTGQSLGTNEGQAEADRTDGHSSHPKGKHKKHKHHKHKHKHRHKHGNHGNRNHAHGGHQHGLSGVNTGGPGTTTDKSSGGQSAAGPAHTHSIPGGQFTHPASAGSPADHATTASDRNEGNNASAGHMDANTGPDGGAGDLFQDALSGGPGYDAGPYDSAGNPIVIDDEDAPGSELGVNAGHGDHTLPADDGEYAGFSPQGHKPHPRIRMHAYIKT
jgi:microcystin-dependent protein